MEQIGCDDRRSPGEQCADLAGHAAWRRVALLDHGPPPGRIEPDDHLLIPVRRIEPFDGYLLAVRRVHKRPSHAHHVTHPLLVGQVPRHDPRRREGSADERLEGRSQESIHSVLRRCRLANDGFDVVIEIGEQLPLEIRVGRGRSRMGGVPNREPLRRHRLEIPLDHRFLEPETKLPIQECLEGGAGDGVVVVRKVLTAQKRDAILRTEERVEPLEIGEPLRRHLPRPVIGGVHALGLGGEEGRELHVARADAEQRRVFAGAPSLHRGAHHHDRIREGQAIVHGRQEHRLCAAAARPGHRDAGWVDLGK